MPDSSYIGATIACVNATPATNDSSGFGALSWTATIGQIVEWSEVGDTSNSIDIPKLSGRITHLNGAKDGGEVNFTFQYEVADAGQVILRARNNGVLASDTVSFRITDPDGKLIYFHGVVANVRDMVRNNSNYKGMTGTIRVNSPTVIV